MRWPRWSRSVSLSDARTNGAVADAKACGPGAPKLALNQGVMIPLMSVAIKPGEPAISVKRHRAGKAGRLGCTRGTCRLHFFVRRRATGGVPSMNDSLEVEVLYPA